MSNFGWHLAVIGVKRSPARGGAGGFRAAVLLSRSSSWKSINVYGGRSFLTLILRKTGLERGSWPDAAGS